MKDLSKELRIGNFVTIDNPNSWAKLKDIPLEVTGINNHMDNQDLELFPHSNGKVNLKSEFETYGQFSQFIKPIPLTKETIEKYIDWSFEFGFNRSVVEKKYWIEHQFLMENAIDGCTDFEIIISENKISDDIQINYYIDDKLLEFGLEDTLHNLQNLFFISTGQELPIKQ